MLQARSGKAKQQTPTKKEKEAQISGRLQWKGTCMAMRAAVHSGWTTAAKASLSKWEQLQKSGALKKKLWRLEFDYYCGHCKEISRKLYLALCLQQTSKIHAWLDTSACSEDNKIMFSWRDRPLWHHKEVDFCDHWNTENRNKQKKCRMDFYHVIHSWKFTDSPGTHFVAKEHLLNVSFAPSSCILPLTREQSFSTASRMSSWWPILCTPMLSRSWEVNWRRSIPVKRHSSTRYWLRGASRPAYRKSVVIRTKKKSTKKKCNSR